MALHDEHSVKVIVEGLPVLVFAALLWTGCADEDGPAARETVVPVVSSSTVAPNPENAISAIVTVTSQGADRLQVEYRTGTVTELTPSFTVRAETMELPVLGLRPEADYTLRVVAASATGDTASGATLTFRTGLIPASVPTFEVRSSGAPEPGFTLLALVPSPGSPPVPMVVVNEAGRVVWYRQPSGLVIDFQLQPNGHYTAAVLEDGPPPATPAVYEEWDALGRLVHTWTTPNFITEGHEIRLLGAGDEALLMGFESAVFDLQPFGGPAQGTVVGNVLQRVTRAGGVLFEWSSLAHYLLEEALPFVWEEPQAMGYDFTHANAIELDTDGNYLISTRHLSEITKIDAATGDIIWRMGKGPANQFTFIGDPQGGFHMPHSIRRLRNGNLILVDNGNFHTPPLSRAVEYEVDEAAKTARLVWSFEPGVLSCCMGFAQRLPGGNTLVNVGQDPRVFEVSPSGSVVWQLSLPANGAGFFGIYRAFRVSSLYGAS